MSCKYGSRHSSSSDDDYIDGRTASGYDNTRDKESGVKHRRKIEGPHTDPSCGYEQEVEYK